MSKIKNKITKALNKKGWPVLKIEFNSNFDKETKRKTGWYVEFHSATESDYIGDVYFENIPFKFPESKISDLKNGLFELENGFLRAHNKETIFGLIEVLPVNPELLSV